MDSTWTTRGIKVEKMTWNQRGKPDVDSIFKYNQISTWKQRQAMTWIQRGFNVIVPAGLYTCKIVVTHTQADYLFYICLSELNKYWNTERN